jgi:hypothetical protein
MRKSDGHIILYTKSHYPIDYDSSDTGGVKEYLTGLYRLYAHFRGYSHDDDGGVDKKCVLNYMYKLVETNTDNSFMTTIHDRLYDGFGNGRYDGVSSLDAMVFAYAMELQIMSVKDNDGNILIDLPEPELSLINVVNNIKNEFDGVPTAILQEDLGLAVDSEDYELAANIRDEIKVRKSLI